MLGLRIALSLIRVYGGRKLKTEIFRPSHRHQSRSRLDLARLAHHDNFRRPLRGSRKGCRSHDPSSTRIARTAPPAEPWHGRRPRRSGIRSETCALPSSPLPHKPTYQGRPALVSDHALSVQAAAGSGLLGASQLSLRAEHAYPSSQRAPLRTSPISNFKSQISNPLIAPQALYCCEHHSSLCVRSTPASPLPTRPSPNPPAFTIPNSHFSLLTSHFPLPTSAPVGRSASKALRPPAQTNQPATQPVSMLHHTLPAAQHPARE